MAEEDSTLEDSTANAAAGGTTQPSFLEGITNAVGLIAGLAAVGSSVNALSEIFSNPTAPGNFVVPDLANNGTSPFGFFAASGGVFGSSSMVNIVTPQTDDALGSAGISPGSWEAIDFMINKALGMDWRVRNADPGNPNILEAYRYAGRAFTQDGGTGQFSWAAAFATWVLVKAGLNGLRTMSTVPFQQYGEVVNFHRGPLTNVRKWDIMVFTSNLNIRHVGFIKSYDPRSQVMEIVGGDQADTVKVSRMPFSVTNPQFRVTHVRRGWTVPDTAATSIINQQRTRPTRPGQQTSGPQQAGTPTFNADGTVQGAGQAARPGPRPAPLTRSEVADRNSGGAAALLDTGTRIG